MARDRSLPADAKKRRVRTAVLRAVFRVRFLRHFYVRRILRFMEKSRAAHRPLPPELVRVDEMLRRLPPHKRAEALETALLARPDDAAPSRELKRAAARSERRRGTGQGYRPGSGSGSPRSSSRR